MNRLEGLKGPLLCSAAMVLVGSTVVVSRIVGQEVEPFLATALRHAAALPLFLALLWWRGELRLPRIDRRDALVLLLQAAAGSVGYTVLLILGVGWAGAADAAVVAGTLPVVAATFAVAVLGERPGPRLLAALALATLGLLAIVVAPSADAAPSSRRLLGLATVLAAVACEAVFILGDKRLVRPLPPLQMSTLMCAGGLLLSLAPALLRGGALPSQGPALAGIVYYAWLPTVGGFLLWYAGSSRTSGATAALTTAWLPIAALLLSALVLGEPVRAAQWGGLACVVAAMALAVAPTRSAPAVRAAAPVAD